MSRKAGEPHRNFVPGDGAAHQKDAIPATRLQNFEDFCAI
jgi:hypothetical protein